MPDRYTDYIPLDEILPAVKNPKGHLLPSIGASIDEFDFTEPPLLDERTGRLVAGHGRLDALKERRAGGGPLPDGIKEQGGVWLVPVTRGWESKSDAQAEAYLLASNRLSEIGGWDDRELVAMLDRIAAEEPALAGVSGWSDEDIALIRDGLDNHMYGTKTDPDDVPEPPRAPVSKRGDLWLCGNDHRVLCGDATSEEDHQRALVGQTVDLVLTDPPYGVGIEYDEFDDTMENTAELVAGFMPLVLRHKRILLTPGVRQAWSYPKPTWILAWVHPAASGAGPWGFNCLNIVLAYGPDPYLGGSLGRRPDTLVMATDRQGVVGHPVAKPIEVWKWMMERGSIHEGDLVFDPFGGSGTTLMTAHLLGRRSALIELSPNYVDVICRRWQEFTGDKPILESTGEAHDFTVG